MRRDEFTRENFTRGMYALDEDKSPDSPGHSFKKKNYVPFVSVRFMFVTELLAILVFKEPSL